MKRKIFTRLCQICLVAAASIMPGCTQADEFTESLGVESVELSVNKKGVASRGQTLIFDVTSNVYWTLSIPEDVDWVAASPVAGHGLTTVQLNVDANYGEQRSAVITISTLNGTTREVTLTQRDASEKIIYLTENMGDNEVEDETNVVTYGNWGKDGITYFDVRYLGTSAYISSETSSEGYPIASGGNNVHLREEGSRFVISRFTTSGDTYFLFQVAVYNPLEGAAALPVKLEIGPDNEGWWEQPFVAASTEKGWTTISADFSVSPAIDELYYRITALVPGVRLDDISITEADETAPLIDFVYDEILYDNFDWLTGVTNTAGEPAEAPDFAARTNGADGMRITTWASSGGIYNNNPGWTYRNDATSYIYSREGMLKVGRTNSTTQDGRGDLVSPKFSRISGKMDVDVYFDALVYRAAGDKNVIHVEVLGEGYTTQTRFEIGDNSWPSGTDWVRVKFTVYDAMNDTQIVIMPDEPNRSGVNNRFYLDNFRVVRSGYEIPDDPDPDPGPDPGPGPSPSGIFYDNFDWLLDAQTADGAPAAAPNFSTGSNGTDGIRIETWAATGGIYDNNPGWTYRGSHLYIYARQGMLKLGRSNVGQNGRTELVSPAFSIPGTQNIDVSFDALVYRNADENNNIEIEVIGAGTPSLTKFTIGESTWPSGTDWVKVKFTVYSATARTQIVIMGEEPSSSEVNNRFYFDNFLVEESADMGTGPLEPAPGGDPSGLPAQWLLTEAGGVMAQYQDTFNGSDMYIDANVEGTNTNASLSFVLDSELSRTWPDHAVGSTGQPYVYGVWPGDYWLFTVPVKDFKGGSKVEIFFLTRSSAGGMKYFRMEYYDGSSWQPAKALESAVEDASILYTHMMNKDATNLTVKEVIEFPQDIASGELKIRFKCVTNRRADNGNELSAPNTGTHRIASGTSGANSPYIKLAL
ncbi:MAG: BACON domain-containing protein [Alistipes sp.]|nr:BACON domain-containing protein [Alistipes sp.]